MTSEQNTTKGVVALPPSYTPSKNGNIAEFVQKVGKPYAAEHDHFARTPYAINEAHGRTDNVYNMHSYHTKVPPQAISRYIRHYTDPGDLVLDVFSGSGMTGVAAQREGRHAILVDLSPAATFISSNNNIRWDFDAFQQAAKRVLTQAKKELDDLYETRHPDGGRGEIIYTIWSEVYTCEYCGREYDFWQAREETEEPILKNKEIRCPHCRSVKKVNSLKVDRDEEGQARLKSVRINYLYQGKRHFKTPDAEDRKKLEELEVQEIPYWYPTDRLPKGYNTDQPIGSHGFTRVSDFYTKRNLWILAKVYELIQPYEGSLRNNLLYWFTSVLSRVNLLNRYMPEHNRHVGPLSGTLYVSKLPVEINVFHNLQEKLKDFAKASADVSNWQDHCIISTQSSTDLSNIPDNAIDFIFTDPPFGDNLMYSELNFLMESWLGVFTDNQNEAIINSVQGKALSDYRDLMYHVFCECYRVLKPERWITVEFHNSKASVWNCIQETLTKAGFRIAQVVTLDKKKGTTKQLSYSGAVKHDLVISAYKPKEQFKNGFLGKAGVGYEYEFVKDFLEHQPKKPNIQRTEQMLYSKMLATYLQHGYEITMNAHEFYQMLDAHFIQRDNFWFTENEVAEYESLKAEHSWQGFDQNVLFISDEKSAITWLNHFLSEPREFAEIHHEFYKALAASDEGDIPDPKEMLQENFILENGLYRRPEVLEKQEMEEKRTRKLLREYEALLEQVKQGRKKLTNVRKEAILAGFYHSYQEKRFEDILLIANKIHPRIIENSAEIGDFVDIAKAKLDL